MDQDKFRKLISGQSRGMGAAFLRFFLGFVANGYSGVIRLRNFLYSRGWPMVHKADAVVVSVGNITVGGTGKTPLVIWLYNYIAQNSRLKTQNYGCAILTRGYKSIQNPRLKPQDFGDEPAMLVGACPGAKVIVNPDRVAGAARAVDKLGAKAVIMDDGFQHRRLHRDLDIITIDATCPFGYGRMLPAGLLREPVNSLKRADAVVITKCDQIGEAELSRIEEKLRQINPDMVVARSVHKPVCVRFLSGREIGVEELKDKKIFAFCGIGNPDAFLNTLKKTGAWLVGSKIYNDHHHYCENDITDICEEAGYLDADLILSTQKDWTKTVLPASSLAGANTSSQDERKHIPFAYLAVELKFVRGEDKITQLLKEALAGKISGN